MTHYIKILPEYFNAVATGRKSFEVRCNDRKYTVGDRLIMQEVDEHIPHGCCKRYSEKEGTKDGKTEPSGG